MTRVLIAAGGAGTSGIGTYLGELHRALRARGHTVDVFVGEGEDTPGRRYLGRVFPRAYARPGSERLRRHIRETPPDVAHLVSSDLLGVDLGVPTVWTAWHHPHGFVGRWNAGLDLGGSGPRQVLWELAGAWPGYRLDDGALRRASRVVAVSRRLATALSERGWSASCIPPMITLPPRGPRSLPPVPRILFSSANLGAPRKGLEFLVQAFERLGMPGRVEVDLIGAPDPRAMEILRNSRLGAVAVRHGLVDLDGARAIMQAASVLAMPSRSEEFGYVALEALALGLPVVAFDVPSLDEMVTTDCGRLVPPLDAGAFAGALRDVLADETVYQRLSAGAIQRAREYAPEACMPRLEALYEDAAETA